MQVRRLRMVGLAIGGAAWFAAIAFSLQACGADKPPAPPAAEAPPPQSLAALPEPAPAVDAAGAPAPQPLLQTADAPVPPRPPLPKPPPRPAAKPAPGEAAAADGLDMEFIVKFKPTHPMGKALALSAAGKADEAETTAKRALRQYRHLAGLCFVRFTMGGAEVVLAPCPGSPIPRNPDLAAKNWLRYLKDIGGVAYVDRNVEVSPTTEIGTP